jgi:hypothetical protein
MVEGTTSRFPKRDASAHAALATGASANAAREAMREKLRRMVGREEGNRVLNLTVILYIPP